MSQEIQKRHEGDERVSLSAASWSGPIPPPDVLRAYESMVPGSVERILANFEAESNHRRQLEREASRMDSFQSNMGLLAGYLIALVIITVAAIAIVRGYSWQGVAILGTGLATLVSIFVTGSKSTSTNGEKQR